MAIDIGRREFILAFGGAAVVWPLAARAQQSNRMRRMGVLVGYAESDSDAQAHIAALRETLQKLGWTADHNIQINERWASGDVVKMHGYAAELVRLNPDVIVGVSVSAIVALLHETRTIPIVFTRVSDPIGSGLIETLSHPNGNATGFTNFEASMGGKWLELLKEIAPGVRRAAIVFNPETAARGGSFYLGSFEAAAASFAVTPLEAPVHQVGEIESALNALASEPNGGVVVMPDAFTPVHRELIVALTARYRLPAVYPFRYFATIGGLMSYGVILMEQFPRAAAYVDRILRGEKPADLPVQQPTKFELVINLKTAKALGLTVPESLLQRSDELIE
ncbi:putative ABC transport system substrate-binding protein [Rhizobiales bacterium GAS191]|nr:putative ABC transport system substrate-binding protein [Rhizobiales bacterium GAS191]SED05064.1 putative ABC transport system substrate-binding protein [Rhizobiales bacterium GAS188]